MEPSLPSPVAALDGCLKLLRGERDEQRLAGLLMASKICKGNDMDLILRVYSAVGPRFLDRLLMTGMGKGASGSAADGGEDSDAYLRLSVTVLAAFCRLPEIAASKDMLAKVPIVAEATLKLPEPAFIEECYEFFISIAAAIGNEVATFYEPSVMNMLASHFSCMEAESQVMLLALKLLQLVLSKFPMVVSETSLATGIACLVVSLAGCFGRMHNIIKFELMHLLTALLSPRNDLLYGALASMSKKSWTVYIHVGVMEILQNRVVPAEKLHALLLLDCMMSIVGESWLLGQSKMHGGLVILPADKSLLLALECARVEVAVLLDELACMKYEASRCSSSSSETLHLKQQNLAIAYSLIEKIIKLISNVSNEEGCPLEEHTLIKAIESLNETVSLALDFLHDSKDHGQKRGNDLLASVRLIGSYLAETPFAFMEKTRELLDYILSVESEEQSSSSYAVCFMLPMLCQTTMKTDGCKALAAFGGHITVMDYLEKMIMENRHQTEHNGTNILACETIINFLLKRKELQEPLVVSDFVHLLRALTVWAEESGDLSITALSACICVLVLDMTTEDNLRKQPGFDSSILGSIGQLVRQCLNQVEVGTDIISDVDLHQLVREGYSQLADRFPHVRALCG